jgi:hypothetical protein
MRFGMGVDSILEEARGEALEYQGERSNEGGQIVRATARMMESQTSLMEAMDISVSLSARYGLSTADAKMQFAEQHAVNEYSLTMLLQADVRNQPRSIISPRLRLEAEELYRREPDKFLQIYGDTYIDEVYGGGEFFGLFIFNTREESTRTQLKAELEVSIGTFIAGGGIEAAFSSTVERNSRRASMQLWALMSGGSGLRNPSNLTELADLYGNFNVSVQAHPIDYKVGLKEFRYLPLPPTEPWTSQLVRHDTIESCGRMIVEAIGQRSRIDYILAHPDQFEPFDERKLAEARAAIAHLIVDCAKRAEKCSVNIGDCSLVDLAPVAVTLPERLATSNPLATKWEKLLRDDRAKGWFSEAYLAGTNIEEIQPANGGSYKLFYKNGTAIAGIFWHPRVGPEAFGVYGGIFAAYSARGHCQGPLGFPTSDERTLTYGSGPRHTEYDGLDRISYFERGVLWWDAQTGVVSDKKPIHPFDRFREPPIDLGQVLGGQR